MWYLTLISHLIPKRICVGNHDGGISPKEQIFFEHLICAKSQPKQTVLTLSSHTVHKIQWIYSLHNTSLAFYFSFIGPLTLIFVAFWPQLNIKFFRGRIDLYTLLRTCLNTDRLESVSVC